MFHCPVCDYSNDKEQGLRVHYFRRHKKTHGAWRDTWTPEFLSKLLPPQRRPRPLKKQPTEATEPSKPKKPKGALANAVRDLLLATPNHQMSVSDLMTALRASGATKSTKDSSLRTYISQCIRNAPECGVVKLARGVYGLNSQTEVSQVVTTALAKATPRAHAEPVTAVIEPAGIPTYDELAGALERSHHSNQKKVAVIEGLARLVVIAAAD